MARSPRVGDTYRASRRNASGEFQTHGRIEVKERPVPGRTWLPKAERQKLNEAKSANRSAEKAMMAKIREFIPSSKRSKGYGHDGVTPVDAPVQAVAVNSSFKKLRRIARRGVVQRNSSLPPSFGQEPTHAEKMQHAWYRKQYAAEIKADRGRVVPPHASGGGEYVGVEQR